MSGYRTDELTNEAAWPAMSAACRGVVDAALKERKSLLDLGFSDSHLLCKELDAVASRFAENEQVLSREWLTAICPEGHEVVSTRFGFQIVQLAAPTDEATP